MRLPCPNPSPFRERDYRTEGTDQRAGKPRPPRSCFRGKRGRSDEVYALIPVLRGVRIILPLPPGEGRGEGDQKRCPFPILKLQSIPAIKNPVNPVLLESCNEHSEQDRDLLRFVGCGKRLPTLGTEGTDHEPHQFRLLL